MSPVFALSCRCIAFLQNCGTEKDLREISLDTAEINKPSGPFQFFLASGFRGNMSASMKECLQLQLLEMEMLFSMFPNQGEVKLEDVNVLTNIKRYLEGTREALPPKIEFVITLQIEEPKVSTLHCFHCCQVSGFFSGNT